MKQLITLILVFTVTMVYAQNERDSLLGPLDLDKQTVYYLLDPSDGVPNEEGLVKLHSSYKSEDSVFVKPNKVYKLYLMPNDESTIFPAVVYNFLNLQELWIGMRGFTAIPDGIVTLANLQTLDVQHCPVSSIPKELSVLENLQNVILTGTKVKNDDINIGLIKEKIKTCNFWMPDGTQL